MGALNIIRVLSEAWLRGDRMDTGAGGILKVLPVRDNTATLQVGDGSTDMSFRVYLGDVNTYFLLDRATQEMVLSGVNLNSDGAIVANSVTVNTLSFTGAFTANTINTTNTNISNTLTTDIANINTLNLTGSFTADTINTNTLNLANTFTAASINTNALVVNGLARSTGMWVTNTGGTTVQFGDATNAATVTTFLGGGTVTAVFDSSTNQLKLNGVGLNTNQNVTINAALSCDNTITSASVSCNAATVAGAIAAETLSVIPSGDDTGSVAIGNTTRGMDVNITLGAAGHVNIDRGAAQMELRGVDINTNAAVVVNSTITTDSTLTCNTLSTNTLDVGALTLETLTVIPSADDTGAVTIGNATRGMDFQVFLGGASTYFLLDRGASQLTMRGVDINTNAGVVVNATVTTDNTVAANAFVGNTEVSGLLSFASDGKWNRKQRAITANTVLNAQDFSRYLHPQGSGDWVITLPSVTSNSGEWMDIINWMTPNTAYIKGASAGDLADAVNSAYTYCQLNSFGSVVRVFCTGTKWLVCPYADSTIVRSNSI